MKKFLFLIFVFSQFLSYPQIKWQQINGPRGGKISYLEVSNTGKYFAGVQADYIYVSSDNGNSWEKTSLRSSLFRQIKADKDGNVFALADLPTATPEAGIFIYEADTKNWKLINNGIPSVGATRIAITSNGDLYLGTARGGIYKSTNKGISWTLSGFSGKYVRSIAVDNNGSIFAGIDFEGIYKSTDNGSTWVKTGNLPINHYTSIYIDQTGTIFTVLFHPLSFYNRGIYRSTDGGNTWQKKDNGIIYPNISSILSIGQDTLVSAGPKGIFYRTINKGDSWEVSTKLPTASPISSICKLPDNSILASSNGIGLIKSNDKGKSFEILKNNFKNMGIRSLVASNNGEIFAISVHDVFKSTDNGLNWIVSSMGLAYSDKTNIFRTQSGKLYTSTLAAGIYQSIDNGINWSFVNTDSSGALSIPIIQKSNGEIFAKAANKNGLVKSTDNGNTWTYLQASFYNVVSALVAGSEGNIYVSSFGTILKSTDDGVNWQIKVHLDPYTTAMKTFNNYVYVTSRRGTFGVSTDKGETWTEKVISNSPIKDLTITKDGTLFIAIPGVGIKMSTDNGQSWTTENNGISDFNFYSFYNDGNDKIYLSTGNYLSNGSGIYLLNFIATGIKSVNNNPQNYFLNQNYPNPFNPSTEINYSIKVSGNVLLKVYDVLGREVAVLKNELEKAGNHKVNFNAENLPSGIYFYSISVGSFHQTKKMILLK